MKKIISMTDFVLEQYEKQTNPTIFEETTHNYANFLKQPLKLEMFVPCDEDGNILKKPKCNNQCDSCDCMYEFNLFTEAKEKVIFEGFEWNIAEFCDEPMLELTNKEVYFLYDVEDRKFENDVDEFIKTIEDLIPYNLELTKNFKQ